MKNFVKYFENLQGRMCTVQDSTKCCFCRRKAVFRDVIHGLFTFSFLSLLVVHLLHGRSLQKVNFSLELNLHKRHDCVFILMKREYVKSFLLTFHLLSINYFFCFNNQVLNVLIQNSSEIREIQMKPAFVFIPFFQFSYHILQ